MSVNAPGSCPTANLSARAARAALTCLVNSYRRQHHRPPLHLESHLTRVAGLRVTDSLHCRIQPAPASCGRTLSRRVAFSGYGRGVSRAVKELHVSLFTTGRATARAAFDVWLNSVSERAKLLSAGDRELGVAVAVRRAGGHYARGTVLSAWALELGHRG